MSPLIHRAHSLLFLFSLLASRPGLVLAQGVSGPDYLLVNVGARALSLGGAYTALSNDASGIFSNPGGIALGPIGSDLSGSFTTLPLGVHYASVCFARSRPGHPAWGLGLDFLGSSDIRRNLLAEEEGEFTNAGGSLVLAGAFEVREGFALGMSLRGLWSRLDDESATGAVVSLGLASHVSSSLSVGAALKNLGYVSPFLGRRDPTPVELKAGLANQTSAAGRPLTLSADVTVPRQSELSLAVGGEYGLIRPAYEGERVNCSRAYLRAGYRSGIGTAGWAGAGYGLGIERVGSGGTSLGIDMAVLFYGDLGRVIQVSLALRQADMPHYRSIQVPLQ